LTSETVNPNRPLGISRPLPTQDMAVICPCLERDLNNDDEW